MAYSPISAQGIQLAISDGSTAGSAKTISSVALGFPTIVTTSAAHGFVKGDSITIAGSTDPVGLNGTFTIGDVTTDTFAIELDTTGGVAYAGSGTATKNTPTYVEIKGVKTYSGFDGKRTEIDVSTLDSVAKEYRPGLKDVGSFQIDMLVDFADAGQQALRDALATTAVNDFKITYPMRNGQTVAGDTVTFQAFVTSVPEKGGVDQVLMSTVMFRITGDRNYTAGS